MAEESGVTSRPSPVHHPTTARQISDHIPVTRLSSTESAGQRTVLMSFSVQIGFVREVIKLYEGIEDMVTLKDIVCTVVKRRVRKNVILFCSFSAVELSINQKWKVISDWCCHTLRGISCLTLSWCVSEGHDMIMASEKKKEKKKKEEKQGWSKTWLPSNHVLNKWSVSHISLAHRMTVWVQSMIGKDGTSDDHDHEHV